MVLLTSLSIFKSSGRLLCLLLSILKLFWFNCYIGSKCMEFKRKQQKISTVDTSQVYRCDSCVFCAIALGQDKDTDLLYKDDNYVAFRNITPVSEHHYLVIPIEHIRDGQELQPQHVSLVEEMSEIGRGVLHQQGGESEQYRLGFHWPPFTSVPHLHLHAISPVKEMSFRGKILFRPGTRWFLTPQEVIEKLNRRILLSSL